MHITIKDNPKPTFGNRSLVTIAMSELQFEDLAAIIDYACGGPALSEEFINRIKSDYQPRFITALKKADEKYKITRK